jgi:hypothetical protein
MSITAEQLLVALSRVVAKYPTATTKWVLNYPCMLIVFMVNDVAVAQLDITDGELTGDV